MRYLLFLILFFYSAAYAQKYKQYDTIADPVIALQRLQAALKNDIQNPELYCLIAQKKFQIGEYDSCVFYCNKSIELLTKNKNNKDE